MPSRRHSSAIFSSPRRPSKTIRTFSSAEYFLRVRRRISRTVASTPAVVSSLIVYSLVSSILTRKSHLSFLPYCVSQVLTRNIEYLSRLGLLHESLRSTPPSDLHSTFHNPLWGLRCGCRYGLTMGQKFVFGIL